MIGVPMLNKLNDMPEEGGHSAIDSLIQKATLSNMKMMYGGGMVQPNYAGGGMIEDEYMKGGKVKKGLKPVPQGNPGLGKLPEMVRNKMGYMEDGGKVGDSNVDLILEAKMKMKRAEALTKMAEDRRKGFELLYGDLIFDDALLLPNAPLTPEKEILEQLKGMQRGGEVEDSLVGMMYGGMANKKKKGYQDGGMIGPPVAPEMMGQAMNQRLDDSIDMRMANPQMGGALGMMRQESEDIEAAMKDNIARNARLALQKMKLDSVMQMEPQGMSIPDSLITNPQSLDNSFLRLLQEMTQSKGVRIPTPSTLR